MLRCEKYNPPQHTNLTTYKFKSKAEIQLLSSTLLYQFRVIKYLSVKVLFTEYKIIVSKIL